MIGLTSRRGEIVRDPNSTKHRCVARRLVGGFLQAAIWHDRVSARTIDAQPGGGYSP